MNTTEDIEFQVIRSGHIAARYDFGNVVNQQIEIMLQRMDGVNDVEKRVDILEATIDRIHADWISKETNLTFQHRIWRKKVEEKLPQDLPFDAKTPLSALFQREYHSMLRSIIESWIPCMNGIPENIDALEISDFQFDLKKIKATGIYIDIGRLLTAHALIDENMKTLAWYLFTHSNLSRSLTALYVQLRTYKKR